jgi:hypothetical protein
VGATTNPDPLQPDPHQHDPRQHRHAADLTRLRRHRRQLVQLTAAVNTLTWTQLPVPEEARERLRRLKTGSVTVWTPCLACRGGGLVRVAVADARNGEPSMILCGPCDERLTREVTPSSTPDGPAQ